MSISNRERYKAIARFQRPGDLFIVDIISLETKMNWVQQGAPEEILTQGSDFFGNRFFR